MAIEINVTVTGTTISAQDPPVIVCSNSGYIFALTTDAEWERIHITCVQDAENTEIDAELTGSTYDIPALPACLAIRVYLTAAAGATERRTDTLYLRCAHSIRDQDTTPYSAPYDAYNVMMEYANGKLSGSMTQERLDAIMAELTAHSAQVGVFPSVAYKRAIAAMSPETKLSGKMTLANGAEIDITNDTVLSSSVGITTNTMRDGYLLPGGVPAAELTATIMRAAGIPHENLRGAKMELTFSAMQENGRWGDVPLGIFDIYGIGDDTATGTPVTAYDAMKQLDGIPLSSTGLNPGTAYSPWQIISAIARTAEIDLADSTAPGTSLGIGYSGDVGVVDFSADYRNNGVETNTNSHVYFAGGQTWDGWREKLTVPETRTDEQVAAKLLEEFGPSVTYKGTVVYLSDLPDGEELFTAYRVLYGGPRYRARDAAESIATARDLLMHTVASINAFACVDRFGKLQIKPIKKRAATTDIIGPKILRKRVSRIPYQLYSLTAVFEYINEEKSLIAVQRSHNTLWDDGVAAFLPENALYPVIDSQTQWTAINQMLINLTDALDPVTYKPARVETYGDPSIDPFEWINIPTDAGEEAVPATEIAWKYRGTQTIDSSGASAVEGLAQSQAEKAILSSKIATLENAYNDKRDINGRFMYVYEYLDSFTYGEIGHYTYAEMERRES